MKARMFSFHYSEEGEFMKIEIAKENPPVISWIDKNGWTQREKITYRSLKVHKVKHRLLVLVLSLLMDVIFDSDEEEVKI